MVVVARVVHPAAVLVAVVAVVKAVAGEMVAVVAVGMVAVVKLSPEGRTRRMRDVV